MNGHVLGLIDKMNAQERIEFYGQDLLISSYEFTQWPYGTIYEFNLENGSKIVINENR
jgi:hypothetical protein